ncbi:hypothetical protein V6N13_049073 [Hibiscus sabdariffa]|uniref:PHD finger family protein n=1 Tax=Hibiscus sabdariffa TaxID=183260 RepID=A0ABR2QYJ0_9ROSI
MTGNLYYRQKKMMGRGADSGCGTEESPYRPISRVSSRSPVTHPETSEKQCDIGVDFFSQARKVLSQRSPFDIPEGGSVEGSSVPTLPSGLASLLKQTDSRKKHKKSHSGADKKSSKQGEKAREASIWVETEEYFRDLTLPDIDALSDITPFRSLTARKKCFMIPYVGNEPTGNLNLDAELDEKAGMISGGNFNGRNENGNIGEEGKEVVRVEDGQLMEIDSGATQVQFSLKEAEVCFAPDSTSSLGWVLGSRSRVLLTSERPSKKRKLVGEDAGLEKILITCPCDVNSPLCDFCCTGDTREESNRLIVCSSCKVAVHRMCYGVQNDVDSSWLCSWCKQGNDGNGMVKPCVLCPKQGGALKPIQTKDGNDESIEFAHLFCSQWVPEVYIEDLTKMEPIIIVGGINDTRKKLVCNVCKVKFGACVRCSHGTCRASFHPICAREARHRMEVWGRYGCDNIEMRVFCSKHSEIQDNGSSSPHGELCASGTDSSITNQIPLQSTDKSQNLKISLSNGDKIAVDIKAPEDNSDKSGDGELQEIGLSDTISSARVALECGETQQIGDMGLLDKSHDDELNPSKSLNFALILKKLIDRGKVNVKDVALEIGLSADSLSASLNNDSLAPDLRCKIVKWLSTHAYIISSQKNLKVNIKCLLASKDETQATDISDDTMVSKSDIEDLVADKPMPPRIKTKTNVKFLRDNKVICSDEIIDDIGVVMDEVSCGLLAKEETNDSSRVSSLAATGKNPANPDGYKDPLESHFHKSEGNSTDLLNGSLYGSSQSERATIPEKKEDQGNSICPIVNPIIADLIRSEEFSNFYIHPYTRKQMLQMLHGMLCKNRVGEFEGRKETLKEFDGARERDLSRLVASSNASVCCSHQCEDSKCNKKSCQSDDLVLSVNARKLGAIKFSPEDEVEGEIIYYQHRLLGNAVARNHVTDNLVSRVSKGLPQEVETARTKIWDTVCVNQYLYELREAKKQGRKERRHKEAQAVLAAATAAVAASSRISSSRKDGLEDSSNQENILKQNASVRVGINSQKRAKDALSRNAVPRISSEKYSDSVQSVTDFSKRHPRSCDICRRSETVLNPILVCSACKVAVHLDCYRNVKESTGNLWMASGYMLSVLSGFLNQHLEGDKLIPSKEWRWLQGGLTFVVYAAASMVHALSYGNCQITFHPSCARSTGFCMNVKPGDGKLLHKAYCELHSVEQRAKVETQKHGIEELKHMKQIRVELERLRLLCERIIKREKLKRELVLCSHEILACKREHVNRSVLIRSPFFRPDVSSESATTSLKGHTDDNKSCSEAMRSDDVTVDSTLSVKHQAKVAVPVDNYQRIDDSSTSQSLFVWKPFSGKQIPHRYSLAARNALVNAELNSKFRKPIETFEKELVMTSDEASMKNSRLPKGYCYVPVDCLPKEKQFPQDACSDGQLEHRG